MSFRHGIGIGLKKLTGRINRESGTSGEGGSEPKRADGLSEEQKSAFSETSSTHDSVSRAAKRRDAEVDIERLTCYFRQTLKQSDLTAPRLEGAVEVPSDTIAGKFAAGCLSQDACEKLFEKHRKGYAGSKDTPDGKPISVLISLVTFRNVSASHEAFVPLLILSAKLSPDGALMPDPENLPWINVERMHRAGVPDEELMVGHDDALHRFWTYFNDHRDDELTEWEDSLAEARRMFAAVTDKNPEAWAAEKNKVLESVRQGAKSQAPGWNMRKESGAGTGSKDRGASADPTSSVIVDTCYVVEGDRIMASSQIQRLYQYLEEESAFPPLYEGLLSTAPRNHVLGSEVLAGTIAQDFTGTMSNEFPLTDTQRIAVRGFCRDGKGEVTAVSGPPGTGKTTMLQAIVASTLVNHALAKADPPIIIGTSTNNQAVTNIIESFGSVAKDAKDNPTVWEHRWIVEAPEDYDGRASLIKPLASLAVYCPSSAKAEEARKRGYLVEEYRGKSGIYKTYSDPDYAAEAHKRFLAFASEAFERHFPSADQAEEAILNRLQGINILSRNLIEEYGAYLNGAPGESVRQCVSNLYSKNALGATDGQRSGGTSGGAAKFFELINHAHNLPYSEAIDELDRLLDITVRYTQFWLAVHYYEAQWVGHEEDNSYRSSRELGSRNPRDVLEYWKQAAALTPCFVMTEYQVPKWMGIRTKEKGKHYDLGRADLLIVDEAGQVDTCVGAAAFALAKRAIVVGDEHQLSPIWSIDPEIDETIVRSLVGNDAWEALYEHGLTCSEPSSIMRAASRASRWCYGPTKEEKMLPGLFLAEHFRCHPLIINYCNELIYEGMLKPRRPMPQQVIDQLAQRAAEGDPLDGQPEKAAVNDRLDDNGRPKAYRLLDLAPNPLLFVTVAGSESQRVGSSRKNPVEARAIASWITENGDFFADIYDKKLGQTIAVVTPFAAQAKCISDALAAAIGFTRAQSITVGTAHRLQGAERPVVLFSCGYGDNDTDAQFINDTLELMNVAVSRAKDLFVIFGAEARWKDRGTVFHLVHKLADRRDGHFAPALEAEEAVEESAPHETTGSAIGDALNPKTAEPTAAAKGSSSPSNSGMRKKSQIKYYLKVAYQEKDEAKKLGAHFDGAKKLWYITDADPMLFERWGVYLNVPYEQKDAAKQLGAKWDKKQRRWYTPAGADLSKFKDWL